MAYRIYDLVYWVCRPSCI